MSNDNKLLPGVKNGNVFIGLSALEAEVLLEVLTFAQNAALLVLQAEKEAGRQPSKKMQQHAADAGELIKIVLYELEVGTPNADEIH